MRGWPTWHRIVGRAGGCGWPGPVPASGAGPPCRAAVLHGFAQCGRIQQNEIFGAEILGLRQTTRHGTFSAEWALDSPPAGPTITCKNVRQFPLAKVFLGFFELWPDGSFPATPEISLIAAEKRRHNCALMRSNSASRSAFSFCLANLPFNLCASHTHGSPFDSPDVTRHFAENVFDTGMVYSRNQPPQVSMPSPRFLPPDART